MKSRPERSQPMAAARVEAKERAMERVRSAFGLFAAAAALVIAHAAAAEDACGLCDDKVVINSDLAGCFLEEYGALAQRSSGAIVVDLSDCASRGVVEALAPPVVGAEEPDVKFMVSRSQLECLKRKLEEPGVVLDPTATIELNQCP